MSGVWINKMNRALV